MHQISCFCLFIWLSKIGPYVTNLFNAIELSYRKQLVAKTVVNQSP